MDDGSLKIGILIIKRLLCPIFYHSWFQINVDSFLNYLNSKSSESEIYYAETSYFTWKRDGEHNYEIPGITLRM